MVIKSAEAEAERPEPKEPEKEKERTPPSPGEILDDPKDPGEDIGIVSVPFLYFIFSILSSFTSPNLFGVNAVVFHFSF